MPPQPKSASFFFNYSTLREWKVLLKSLKDMIMTSSSITLDIKLTVTAIQSICTEQVLSHVQLSCFVSTLQFKRYMDAFEKTLFTDLSLMSNFQSQNLSIIPPLLRSVSTLSARSKLQQTGDLPLQERGIHSRVVTSSPSTARDSTELHSWHAGARLSLPR